MIKNISFRTRLKWNIINTALIVTVILAIADSGAIRFACKAVQVTNLIV